MLKISIVDSSTRRRIVLEGALIVPWLSELSATWRKALRERQGYDSASNSSPARIALAMASIFLALFVRSGSFGMIAERGKTQRAIEVIGQNQGAFGSFVL